MPASTSVMVQSGGSVPYALRIAAQEHTERSSTVDTLESPTVEIGSDEWLAMSKREQALTLVTMAEDKHGIAEDKSTNITRYRALASAVDDVISALGIIAEEMNE